MMINFPHDVLYPPRYDKEAPLYRRMLLRRAKGCGVPYFHGVCIRDMSKYDLYLMVSWLVGEILRDRENTLIRDIFGDL